MTQRFQTRPRAVAALLGSVAIIVLAVAPSFAHTWSRPSDADALDAVRVVYLSEDEPAPDATETETDEPGATEIETDEPDATETDDADHPDLGPGVAEQHHAVEVKDDTQGANNDDQGENEQADTEDDQGEHGNANDDSGEHHQSDENDDSDERDGGGDD
jgi:type IV secretory pathway VirB10-like protein